jgi:glyoxylase-like metal-dependent hydrolase (beta-lactamase superfamily II)/rhodanese-related sulfurtransferase
MFFKRYYLGCLAHASYMIADEKTGVAAVVDPQRDIDQYVQDAEQHGFQIRYVFLTHFHADFIAGHIELRDRLGASIYLGSRAQAEYEFSPVKDGDVLEIGQVRFQIMETPGHTPEGISILVYDLKQSDRTPHAVLTGDTLFIGDVGRPDLLASVGVTADELAEMLYHSLHDKLMALPDETLVYPAHGAGSMCGKNLSDEASSTIGQQRRYNYALQSMSKEEFKQLVTADQPEAPAYFVHDAVLNRQDRQSLEQAMHESVRPIGLDDVLRLQADGAQIVDVRDAADFAGAHLAGSLNIGLDGKYATWAGTILSKEQPIVVVADQERVNEAIMRLGRIGLDNAAGYLEHGVQAIDQHPELMGQVRRITAPTVSEQIEAGDPPLVIDIRTQKEWEAGHIEGSVNIPLNELSRRLDEVPTDTEVIVHCQGGYRSSLAVSLLQQQGRKNVTDLVGGFAAWKASHLPVAGASDAAACSTGCSV